MRRNLLWLSDDQWQPIELLLPTDDRRVISGILHVLKSGCRWCDCPPEYGPPTTMHNRRRRLYDHDVVPEAETAALSLS